ncbi:hypothetical protein D3C77_407410 [compost metagenome]
MEGLQALPGPLIDGVVLMPCLPLLAGCLAVWIGTKARVPLRRVTQRLALSDRGHASASSANSRQRSVALATYLVTELTETSRRLAISA